MHGFHSRWVYAGVAADQLSSLFAPFGEVMAVAVRHSNTIQHACVLRIEYMLSLNSTHRHMCAVFQVRHRIDKKTGDNTSWALVRYQPSYNNHQTLRFVRCVDDCCRGLLLGSSGDDGGRGGQAARP